jgi:hypothetical protein
MEQQCGSPRKGGEAVGRPAFMEGERRRERPTRGPRQRGGRRDLSNPTPRALTTVGPLLATLLTACRRAAAAAQPP